MPRLVTSHASRKPALGRGLNALIAEAAEPTGRAGGLMEVPVEQIEPDPQNPRRAFDEAALDELATSLTSRGMLQPILLRREGEHYRIIAGERRFRAACRAGWSQVPALVKDVSESDAYLDGLIENVQREDLSPLEEAQAYAHLVHELQWTQERVATRVGKDRSSVANALRLLSLPDEVKGLLAQGTLDMGHARALLGISKASELVAVARRVVAQRLSVRQTEALVKGQRPDAGAKKRPPAGRQSPGSRQVVEDLQRRLGTKVRLKERGAGRGTLEVDYFSFEDLDRILGVIMS
jgi:ParB family chromosome partitioning protein